jgi:CheY-like chemotaxis protein/anti-sigma regulatory factor (Ser/Thr protein kinase)
VPTLFADSGQLETVLMNLANNARDALVKGTGTIRLTAVAASIPGDAPAQLAPGTYVCLSVVDDGVGMPPDVLAQVAEAFFTTKPKGQGTGLGVTMAHEFAEQSGGVLTIESALGEGTTVSLWLPVAPADVVGRSQIDNTAPEHDMAHQTGTAILLVDDEPGLRTGLAALLADQGVTVTEAEDAASALALLDSGLKVDVLVTDFVMPGGMDGLELVREARRRRPGLPAVLITGHSDEADGSKIEQVTKSGSFVVLAKPFSAKTLTARLALMRGGPGHLDSLTASKSYSLAPITPPV